MAGENINKIEELYIIEWWSNFRKKYFIILTVLLFFSIIPITIWNHYDNTISIIGTFFSVSILMLFILLISILYFNVTKKIEINKLRITNSTTNANRRIAFVAASVILATVTATIIISAILIVLISTHC